MAVSRSLGEWLWLLEAKKPRSWKQWAWILIMSNRFSWMLMIVTDVMLGMAAVRSPSMKEAVGSAIMCSGFYTGIAAQYVYIVRHRRTNVMLARMMVVARAVEGDANEQGKAALERSRREITIFTYFMWAYAAAVTFGMWAQIVYWDRPFAAMWPLPPMPQPLGRRLVGLLECVTMAIGCIAMLPFMALFGCIVMALTAQFKALSAQLEMARTWPEVIRVVQLHQQLHESAREAERFFGNVIGHVMPVMLIMPLVATLRVVFNQADFVTMLGSSNQALVLLNMSRICHDLTDASTGLGKSAYRTAFSLVGEAEAQRDRLASDGLVAPPRFPDLETRRALLLMMVSVTRPLQMSISGVGTINMATARKALRSWYQMSNMVIGMATREA